MKVIQDAQSSRPGVCLEKDEKWVAIAAMWPSKDHIHEELGEP